MKRIVSILISLAALISAFPVCAERDTEEDKSAESKYEEYIDIAEGFGIVNANFLENHDEFSKISRSEFAELMCNIMQVEFTSDSWSAEVFSEDNLNKEGEIKKEESIFDDVSVNDESYKYILAVSVLGIMNGTDSRSFSPDENITLLQAYKCITGILGYNTVAEKRGGYPNGILNICGELGIMKNIQSSANSEITLGELCMIFYNMLDVELLQLKSIGAGGAEYKTYEGETFMKKKLNAYKTDGLMSENTLTDFTIRKSVGSNDIVVNGIRINVNENQKVYNKLIGRYVTAYYKSTDDETSLIYMSVSKKDNAVLLSGDDVNEYISGSIYTDRKTYSLSKGAYVIYNGAAVSSYDKDNFVFDNGDITLSKTGGSSAYNIAVINSYRSAKVSSVDNLNEKIMLTPLDGTFRSSDSIDVSDNCDVFLRDSDGIGLPMEAVRTDSIIEFTENSGVVNIIVTNDKVESFEVKSVKNKDGYVYISSGEDEYFMENEYIRTNEIKIPQPGTKLTLYLNSRRGVVWYESIYDEKNIGYIISIIPDSEEETVYFRIFSEKGKMVRFTMADKITVVDEDGFVLKTDKYNEAAARLSGYTGIAEYKYNDKEEITKIELPKKANAEKDELCNYTKLYGLSEVCVKKNRAFYNSNKDNIIFAVKGRTKIITVPSGGAESEYAVSDYTGDEFIDYREYKITGYGTEHEYGIADYLVLSDESGADINWSRVIAEKTNVFVVNDVTTDFIDGEIVNKISVYDSAGYNGNDEITELYCEESNGKGIFESMNDFLNSEDDNGNIREYKAEKGDIIICSYNQYTRYARACRMVFKANEPNRYISASQTKGWLAGTKYSSDENEKYKNPIMFSKPGDIVSLNNFYAAQNRIFCGYVIGLNNSVIKATVQDLSAEPYDENSMLSTNWFLELNSATTVTYDKNLVSMKKYSSNDIKGYDEYGSDCSRIIVISRDGGYCNVILINGTL